MSTITHTDQLTLDLSAIPGNRSDLTVYAKQEDNTRRVRITLQENGTDYQIPDGVSVLLRALKPDGHFVLTDSPFEGCYVYLTLPREMLTCAGCVRAEICLTAGDEILTTATFYVEVVPTALSDIASGNDLSALAKALDAAAHLTEQALLPIAVETVKVDDGFDTGAATPYQYTTAPVWQTDGYVFDGSGIQYSDAHSAYAAGSLYFFDTDDRSSYCKLSGSGSSCNGYIRYRPLGTSGGVSGELRSLLDGLTVEGRALPTENEVTKLGQLVSNYYLTANSTQYYLVEMTMMLGLHLWNDYFVNYLVNGKPVDFGDGVERRFVTVAELEEINRRLTALGG